MKKLGKLKLNNFSEMSEQEMKYIMGGKDYDLCGDRSSDRCAGGEVCTSDEFAILYQREFHYVWWRALHDNSFLCLCEYFWKILIWKC